jgi:hypothetical protein
MTKKKAVLDPSEGGKARAEALPASRRSEIAAAAADARWSIPQATHAGEIELSGHKIPCAVLDNGLRVLTQEGFLVAIGRTAKPKGGQSMSSPDGLPPFLASDVLKPFVAEDLRRATAPVTFRTFASGESRGCGPKRAYGYDANLLPMVCEVYLRAKAAGMTTSQQEHIVQACSLLMCGFARVGLAAMIDEATGFQEVRDRRALQAILDLYLRQELAAWAKMFPDEFYKEMFRLKGWTWKTLEPSKGPRCIAQYTKDIAYERLAPGVLEELERRNPVQASGASRRRKAKHHQWLTDDIGHPALSQHIHAVTAIMRISHDWDGFMRNLDRAFPRRGRFIQLDFDDVAEFTPREDAASRPGDDPSALPAEQPPREGN